MLEELAHKHRVHGSLIAEMTFQIVEVLGELAPLTDLCAAPAPPGARPAA
jgi:hypothetical protein